MGINDVILEKPLNISPCIHINSPANYLYLKLELHACFFIKIYFSLYKYIINCEAKH